MCGIVGYIGSKDCVPLLINSLKRLEYRGYDSAGLGVISNGESQVIKRKGKVSVLEKDLDQITLKQPNLGIAHTRWATHGVPNEVNAHPHFNTDKSLFVIHNGIIENYLTIRKGLQSLGYDFITDTDSEVIPQLIDSFLKKGYALVKAVHLALSKIEGTYGLAIVYANEPDKLIAARKGSPLVIGVGNNENFVASDVSAIIAHTKHVVYLEDGEIAEIYKDKFYTRTLDEEIIDKEVHKITMTLDEIDKGGYDHFMLKEIMEQPLSVCNSMRGRLIADKGTSKLGGLEAVEDKLVQSKRIVLSACGTSWHAALAGEYMLEQHTRIQTEVEYASEFRYRNPIISPDDVMFFISQSGETADTLAALREAKIRGALVLGICNVVGSSIPRETHAGVYTHAGPEIGVASTKAFTSQLVILALITLNLARKRNMSLIDGKNIVKEMDLLPKKIEQILKLNEQIEEIAEEFKDAENFLYLGRGYNFPVALEGALKLKEISYIHAEGYPAAEMKHGPIALIEEKLPSIFIAPQDSTYEKIITNIQEVKARKGRVIAIASESDKNIDSLVDFSIKIPETIRMLMPILSVIPLQLLAYHIAVKKGLNVDQPRNLAKSVTVE
ncbi:MAG: glutamine--fructose-6-phosphate transaminase (isomerizing) [Ignavibacteriales bacterium CG_4_9_14_3_um_filter_30_11]|nr:MAG: glutamine--fructose-6-phosphate transaminase (isomerizing) [Ignavibacteriales bacterium CG_4_9_14_3_um_filter_30_11]